MAPTDEIYSAKIFFNAVLPLFKEIALSTGLKRSFAGKNGVIQVSAIADDGKWGTHFLLSNGAMTVQLGTHPSPTVDLEFKTLRSFNDFFKGTSKILPKIKGISHLGLLVPTFRTLLKMAALLGAKGAPANPQERILLVRLYFYLLSSGISQLNKCGHPEVSSWAKTSPDRVYAWSVDNYPELAAFIRVKAGKTKSSRGLYQRSKPFFTMRFDTPESALGILLQKDDMLASTTAKKLIMEGAPEFGAQIGNYMMLVGSYAK
ncbi:MAG TPA: hypothetical protein DHD79_06170 [Firmicutes bacterium]|mgnify:FL=1|nr:hypothetical protein [Bacillota bacterium]HAW71961.1 hypothetical protein [Bacillota bacterium]HAZ22513.1 hypothetical protein [Bacillota bacterium]HBE04962.1 hypothetical protein [Bacillota bacterium]HBG44951.1 hypothetical protein [Bacillota bacterium]